ncbi:hypothetical protein ACQEU8_21740 [Streptomyces sp. CA-250714]|uniref:hypothetical protein n=1 Tax=Streptomyces sp. CA-250714 TaxID=3240060 RepID=UPI003D9227DF
MSALTTPAQNISARSTPAPKAVTAEEAAAPRGAVQGEVGDVPFADNDVTPTVSPVSAVSGGPVR